jgi:hypothetical protein
LRLHQPLPDNHPAPGMPSHFRILDPPIDLFHLQEVEIEVTQGTEWQ